MQALVAELKQMGTVEEQQQQHLRPSFGYRVYHRSAPVGQTGRSVHTGPGDRAYRLHTVRSAHDLAHDCQTAWYAAGMQYPEAVML
jgi:hypothetical protein